MRLEAHQLRRIENVALPHDLKCGRETRFCRDFLASKRHIALELLECFT